MAFSSKECQHTLHQVLLWINVFVTRGVIRSALAMLKVKQLKHSDFMYFWFRFIRMKLSNWSVVLATSIMVDSNSTSESNYFPTYDQSDLSQNDATLNNLDLIPWWWIRKYLQFRRINYQLHIPVFFGKANGSDRNDLFSRVRKF